MAMESIWSGVEAAREIANSPKVVESTSITTGEGLKMGFMTRLYVRARQLRRGQTMTEYALILAAIAIVVFATYEVMGQDIGSLVSQVDRALTTSA
jgi:Flp pilus assembly pilin Flp